MLVTEQNFHLIAAAPKTKPSETPCNVANKNPGSVVWLHCKVTHNFVVEIRVESAGLLPVGLAIIRAERDYLVRDFALIRVNLKLTPRTSGSRPPNRELWLRAYNSVLGHIKGSKQFVLFV